MIRISKAALVGIVVQLLPNNDWVWKKYILVGGALVIGGLLVFADGHLPVGDAATAALVTLALAY